MIRLVLIAMLVIASGCKKKAAKREEPAAVPTMSEIEIKRSNDACKQYVDRVCACAANQPDLAKECELAKALPDAVRIGLEVAASPDSKPDLVEKSFAGVRKTVAECIQQTAKLPPTCP